VSPTNSDADSIEEEIGLTEHCENVDEKSTVDLFQKVILLRCTIN